MKKYLFFLFTTAWSGAASGQSAFTLGFERPPGSTHRALPWTAFGSEGCTMTLDSAVRHSGVYSFCLRSPTEQMNYQYAAGHFTIPARYAGKVVELSGYVRTRNVIEGWAGLWMRIDGNGNSLAFDNMEQNGILGTTDWTHYTIRLPLPEKADEIHFGGLLTGNGAVWLDDLSLKIDGKELAL